MSSPQDEAQLCIKYDYELTKKELDEVFNVYNECFYNAQLVKPEYIKLAKDCLGKSRAFRWYLMKVPEKTPDNVISGSKVVGIAGFIYDFTNVEKRGFAIDRSKGENVSSIAVLPDYRGQGFVYQMLSQMIKDYGIENELVLKMEKNQPLYEKLLAFYQGKGFEIFSGGFDHVFLRRSKSV